MSQIQRPSGAAQEGKVQPAERPTQPTQIQPGDSSPRNSDQGHYGAHPSTAIYPDITGAAFERIKDDIRGGLSRKVTIFENKILDGRATYRAHRELGLISAFEFLEEKDCPDPIAFVRSRNSVRRQLGRLQLACVAVNESELSSRTAAKERQGKPLPDESSGRRHDGEWATQAANAHGAGINAVRQMANMKKRYPDVFDACWRGLVHSSNHARHLGSGSAEARAWAIDELEKAEGVGDPLKLLQKYARTYTRAPRVTPSDQLALHHGDAETVAIGKIPKASVNLLLSDPPWQHTSDATKPWAITSADEAAKKIATIALYALKPGGTLAVLVGNTCTFIFDKVFREAGLFPRWSIAALQPNGANTWGGLVQKALWRPVLLYTAHLAHHGRPLASDMVKAPSIQKDLHPWQQSEEMFRQLVDLLSEPGDLILDPFMGSGTTGAAALRTGRRFIGIDSDEESFRIASKRLSEIELAEPEPVAAE